MKLRNIQYKNLKLATKGGELSVDENGTVEVEDKDVAKVLFNSGWQVVGKMPAWLVQKEVKVVPVEEQDKTKPELKPEEPKEEVQEEEPKDPEQVENKPKEAESESEDAPNDSNEPKKKWQRSPK